MATKLLVSVLAGTTFPGQTVCVDGIPPVMVGLGLTIKLNVVIAPIHAPRVGVTVMVAIIGVSPMQVAVNAGISPMPFAAKPIEGSLFVQVYVAPAGELAKAVNGTLLPSQVIMFEIGITVTQGVNNKLFAAPAFEACPA